MMKTIWIGVACLLVGLVVGRYLPHQDRSLDGEAGADEESGRARVASRMTSHDRVGLARRSEEGVDVPDSGLAESSEDGSWVTVPASLISELSLATGTRSAGQDLFSGDGKMEKYLQITDQEKAVVQKAWRQSRQKVQELEAKSSVSEDQEDGSVLITVPDLAGEMRELGEDFQSSVNEALGENRSDAFLAMKQVDRMYSPAAGKRVYKVSVEAVGDGRWRYHMTFVDGGGERRVWVGEKVPNEIRHLTDVAKIEPSMNPPEDDEDE